MRVVSIRILFICGLLTAHAALAQTIVLGQSATGNAEQSPAANAPVEDPLLRLLVSKSLLTTEEAGAVLSAGTPAAQRDRLALLLKNKRLISTAEFDALQASAAVPPATGGNTVNVNATSSGANGSTARAPSASSPPPYDALRHRCRCTGSSPPDRATDARGIDS
jgi:hypothetical protein